MIKYIRSVEEYFIYFLFYSIIGWLYEVFLEVVIYNMGFSNRGVLFGPYCPVYGFGALTFILCFGKLMKKKIKIHKLNVTPIIIFIGMVITATIIEIIASYILEFSMGKWLWDYSNYAFNFEGRIALNTSLRFGIGGMIFIYLFQPFFEKVIKKLSDRKVTIISCSLFVVFFIDITKTLI